MDNITHMYYRIKILWLLVLTFVGCKSVHVFSEKEFKQFLQKENRTNTLNLRWNGYFDDVTYVQRSYREHQKTGHNSTIANALKEDKRLHSPYFFFLNGIYTRSEYLDEPSIIEWFKSDSAYIDKTGWGAYKIQHDTITGMFYRRFQNRFRLPRWDIKIVKYDGKILNDSTIINWRQVSPFPNFEADQLDTIPSTLVFRSFLFKNIIDSSRAFKNE